MGEVGTPNSVDLVDIRVEQAKLLKKRVKASCLIVLFLITYIAGILFLSGDKNHAVVWGLASIPMVAITFLYARFTAKDGVTRDNVQAYLRGHIIISCMTGLVWSGFAILYVDWTSYLSIFVAGTVITTITLGGMFPSSAYRPGYIGLATFTIIPLALFWLVSAPGAIRLIGLGLLLYYALGMITSAQAEINMRETIAGRNASALTEKLTVQNETIQKANDERLRFMAATSHDLSQPLHAQGFFISALRKILTDDAQHDVLNKIERSWQSQSHLLQGLVDITRIDQGAIIPNARKISLKAELENIEAEFKGITDTKAIDFRVKLKDVNLHTDPVLLGRIVRNLVSNAIKFTPGKGVVEISNRKIDELAIIEIRDTGTGISDEDQKRIFEEYVQLANDQGDREQGLGLGLSIVRRLTAFLNIDLGLKSAVGEGTTITLTLPIDASPSPDFPGAIPNLQKLPNFPLVVLVDDEKEIRESMSTLLTGWGCKLVCASNSRDAIVLLNQTIDVPDLLIIDKRLYREDESGLDLIHILREEVNEQTPAILMTGDLEGFGAAEPDESIILMTKPIAPEEIHGIIKSVLSD